MINNNVFITATFMTFAEATRANLPFISFGIDIKAHCAEVQTLFLPFFYTFPFRSIWWQHVCFAAAFKP